MSGNEKSQPSQCDIEIESEEKIFYVKTADKVSSVWAQICNATRLETSSHCPFFRPDNDVKTTVQCDIIEL